MNAPWIICEGCIAIVDLVTDPDDDRSPMIAADGSWTCRCPACGRFNSGARIPTASEIQARLEAITAPILARLAVEPADPNQINLPFPDGAS